MRPRACVLQQEKPQQWRAPKLQLEWGPHLSQLETSSHSNEDPAQPNKQYIKTEYWDPSWIADSKGMGCGKWICISNTCPDAAAAGETHFENHHYTPTWGMNMGRESGIPTVVYHLRKMLSKSQAPIQARKFSKLSLDHGKDSKIAISFKQRK